MTDPTRYTAEIDLRNVNDSHTFAVAAVPARSAVLDVGAADGSMARTLRQMGCRVWGVEFDPSSAALARAWCEEVVEGDVEQLDFAATFDQKFDVILFLDVLEHLKDPLTVLRNAQQVLADGGHIVISLPNVAHAAMRAQLLSGRFAYTEVGLLDQTHLRFFDPTSVRQFLRDAGLVVLDESRVTFPIDGTEIDVDVTALDPAVLKRLEEGEEANSYQFLFVVAPIGSKAAVDPPLFPARILQRELRRIRDLDSHSMTEFLSGLLHSNRARRDALAELLRSLDNNDKTLQ
jgi:2-polyprenyl-3-methyl-5-hydroxy-6-metoxy-1,4-benzoquinol methylase